MIDMSDRAAGIVTHSYVLRVRAESWLGGELLADDVPIAAAYEEGDRSQRVPETLTITVPRLDRGTRWTPTTPDHPLAANGQRLRVQLGVDIGQGETEWLQRGWFLVQDTPPPVGDTISLFAVGLLALVDEARLVSPFQPTGTFVSTLRALVEPALTVDVSGAPADRSVPAGMNWDEDRLAAVGELLDAWPAEAAVDAHGVLVVTAVADPGAAVLELTDRAGGTVIRASGGSSRDGGVNAVVARGTAPDGGIIQAVQYDTVGPKAYGGPFNPLPVPELFYSPLLTTVPQCAAAAATIIRRRQREQATTLEVDAVPHPGVQLGDPVTVTTDDYAAAPGTVESYRLPYVPDGSPLSLGVRVATS